ncbi:L-2-hydroxyglutarate oxidase [Actinoplanes bogorensis]|uniref:L-2-hydroxyglutarate oxidase n=1 Tax=Paractinoplanes bogorensis TaxID=1610840 RepID=A0ABS5YUC0_9ACTN|nr:L-2-hydroxyglutarate oxidase [Actinoplanes bogorensis]MBU2667047.1 L-2-hydroxyglutarate oxidase [Actinoplanes bogorensis]
MNIGVVGAGILGLAIARRLQQARPTARVTVLEKETAVAQHQTGHNSGVVHAGIYYPPGSLKAELCRRGSELLRVFCTERGLPYDECGKLVVATTADQLPALHEIERRAKANRVPSVRWLDGPEITSVEPYARGVAALHSPVTAITDFAAVSRSLAAELEDVRFSTAVREVRPVPGGVELIADRALKFDHVILCAGLQSDRLAATAGDRPDPAILPFRGEYLKLIPERTTLVRGLIYPVPDPRYPFLGVHFTRRVDGSVDVGPNAVLATAREGYRRRDISAADVRGILGYPGFWSIARYHWRMGLVEVAGSASMRVFVNRARAYVPSLRVEDVVRGGAGVRAQAVDRNGTLVDDFRIHRLGRVTALRNAPSPAATSSLAIAEHVVDQIDFAG